MRSFLLLLGAAVAAAGCTVPSSSDAPDAEAAPPTAATAIVVVERTSGPTEAAHSDSVVARFVRVRQGQVDDEVLRIAGIAQDLPAVGSCSGWTDPPPPLRSRAVELLDVGPVSLRAEPSEGGQTVGTVGRSTVLLPRAMPDAAGVISGVFYSSSARAGDTFTPGARLNLRASGGPDLVDGFAVNVAAPHDVADVRVTPTTTGLDVAWDASDADARDLVYIDVLAPRLVVRCTSTDGGRIFVPTGTLSGVDDGHVAVHRVHREPFRAKGVDPGEIRFDVARVVAFHK